MLESKMVGAIEAVFDGAVLRPETTLALEPNARVRLTIQDREVEPTHLYHYTTAKGFKGIVESQEAWATHILYLNDWRELWNGRDKLAEAIRKKIEDGSIDRDTQEISKMILERLVKSEPICGNVSVCSFSSKEDDLSQWRAYCPNGGYSIGFPYKGLEAIRRGSRCGQSPPHDCNRDRLRLEECRYVGGCDDHLGHLLKVVKNISANHDRDTTANASDLVVSRFAAIYKNREFACEKEWRLICLNPQREWKFRTRGASLVPYQALCLHDAELWGGARIFVSPCSRESGRLRVESVKTFLESALKARGLPTTCTRYIEESKIPFRSGVSEVGL
ncbi:MAG: DUF2971 domain-containing protein [Planctomycetes bacterium]|jgi:hypothetical protein|nr:DUF2971 domain-containing protein [Planctomycetota bacterium]